MLNAHELQNKITHLLAKIHEENVTLQQSFSVLPSDSSNVHLVALYIENMYEIRRQLQELVGDTAAIAMIAKELGTDMKPPILPTGYVALSTPRPLIGANDELWVVLADHGDLGILIYEEHFCRAFLVAEECLTMLYTLMEYTQKFFGLCTAEYLNNPVHQLGLARIRKLASFSIAHGSQPTTTNENSGI